MIVAITMRMRNRMFTLHQARPLQQQTTMIWIVIKIMMIKMIMVTTMTMKKRVYVYLTSSQTITTTDITPVTRPNMCNNWNQKLLDYISQQSVKPDSET